MRVQHEGVGGGHDALHEHGHAQVAEVQAHLAHAQQRALVVLARPHALHQCGQYSLNSSSHCPWTWTRGTNETAAQSGKGGPTNLRILQNSLAGDNQEDCRLRCAAL